MAENKDAYTDEEQIVLLTDEEGGQTAFVLLDDIAEGDTEYIVITPADVPEDDAGDVFILSVNEEPDGGARYESVEDEEILNRIYEIFRQNNQDEYDFED